MAEAAARKSVPIAIDFMMIEGGGSISCAAVMASRKCRIMMKGDDRKRVRVDTVAETAVGMSNPFVRYGFRSVLYTVLSG